MALSTCDPCCRPTDVSRSNDSFKASVLIIMCAMLEALGGGTESAEAAEANFDPVVTKLASFFTNAYQVVLTPSGPVDFYTVTNTSDALLSVSFDNGATVAAIIQPESSRIIDFGSSQSTAPLYSKYLTAPTTGTDNVYFETLLK